MEFSELVSRFAAAAASGNGDALADLFTPDGTYDDYFFGPSTGREAIKAMLAHFSDGGQNFRWEFFDAARSGNTATRATASASIPSGGGQGRARSVRRHRPFQHGRRPHPPLLGSLRPRHGAGAAGVRARTPAQDRPQVCRCAEIAAGMEGPRLVRPQPGDSGDRSRIWRWHAANLSRREACLCACSSGVADVAHDLWKSRGCAARCEPGCVVGCAAAQRVRRAGADVEPYAAAHRRRRIRVTAETSRGSPRPQRPIPVTRLPPSPTPRRCAARAPGARPSPPSMKPPRQSRTTAG